MDMNKFIIFILFICPVFLMAQEAPMAKRLELGYVRTDGNAESETVSLKAELKKQWTQSSLLLHGMTLSSSQAGKEIASRTDAGMKGERKISGRFFASLGATYEKNRFAGFEYRIQVGPGLGMDAIKNSTHTLNATFSTVIFWEKTTAQNAEAQRFFSVKAVVDDQWKINAHVTLKNKAEFFTPLRDSDKYFINWNASLEAALNKVLSLGMGYTLNYQNKVHNPQLKKTDTALLTSLIANF